MYALVDCNNFYCSCERVFQPHLDGLPVVVLSNNDGCAISRSEEAKILGIEMGKPEFQMREEIKQHNIAIFSSNYTLYEDMSKRVMEVLASFVPRLEVYSIDEAFLDMHDLYHEDLLKLGLRIRKVVQQYTGIPVSLGIGRTKALAKMANRYAKKFHKDVGAFWAANEKLENEMLQYTEVGDIWGIGRQYAQFLQTHGIYTAADFTRLPEEWIRKEMSVVGQRLWNDLNGHASIQWEFDKPAKKNICTARSFGKLFSDRRLIKEALVNYAASCAQKLREQKSCARTVHVFLQTNQHRIQDAQYKASINVQLMVATNNTAEIIKQAIKGFNIIFRSGHNYKKCGVIVTDLIPEQQVQDSFFDHADRVRKNKLMHILDRTNKLFGKDIVRMAVQGYARNYKLRADHISKRYTTNLAELPILRN